MLAENLDLDDSAKLWKADARTTCSYFLGPTFISNKM